MKFELIFREIKIFQEKQSKEGRMAGRQAKKWADSESLCARRDGEHSHLLVPMCVVTWQINTVVWQLVEFWEILIFLKVGLK